MDFSKKKVSLNFRSIWKRKQMDLTDMTQEMRTSKSIFCQIGLDEANPTIGTVGKLIGRLRVDCMNLIASPQDEGYLVSRKLLSPGEGGQEPHQAMSVFLMNRGSISRFTTSPLSHGSCYRCASHGERTRNTS